MIKFKNNADMNKFIEEMFFLAWKGCKSTTGLGALQDKPDATSKNVFDNIKGSLDCLIAEKQEYYADYVFGRSMKIGITIESEQEFSLDSTLVSQDYQKWCQKYATYDELFSEAFENCGIIPFIGRDLADNEVIELMSFLGKHDICGLVSWDESLSFYVNCNDVFYWGGGDSEDITKDNLELFKKSVLEAGFMGPILFCARVQKTRPQGAWYRALNEKYHHLFDAVGEEREIDAGNPKHQDDYKKP